MFLIRAPHEILGTAATTMLFIVARPKLGPQVAWRVSLAPRLLAKLHSCLLSTLSYREGPVAALLRTRDARMMCQKTCRASPLVFSFFCTLPPAPPLPPLSSLSRNGLTNAAVSLRACGTRRPVARDLKVSVARLLKKCREFGILRWPYRHVSCTTGGGVPSQDRYDTKSMTAVSFRNLQSQ